MASRPNTQGGASALPFDLAATVGQKVVRLPTAAPRKPLNHRFAAQCYSAIALREAQPWPGEHMWPMEREAARRIRELRAMPPSAAVNMARMLLEEAGTDDAQRVLRIVERGVEHGEPFAVEVRDLMERTAGRTVGEQFRFAQALKRLNGAADDSGRAGA